MNLPDRFYAGAVFEREDGARLRIDSVTDAQVYFVSWLPDQELGSPIRMDHVVFVEAWENDWVRGVRRMPEGGT